MRFDKTKVIDPLEERNKAFMDASNQATDEYLSENQNNPMAFMDILQGSITPPQETQIPFAPQDRTPASLEQELVTQEEALSQPELPPSMPSQPRGSSNYDRILNELKAIRSGSDADIQAARQADSKNTLLDSLSKSAQGIGDAFANKAGYTKIKSDPISLKSNLSEQAEGDRKRKLEDLMTQYKMMSDKENKDADRDYKKQMLDLQKKKVEAKGTGSSAFEKERSKALGKAGAEWMSKDRDQMFNNRNKVLEGVKLLEKAVKSGSNLSGGVSEFIPGSDYIRPLVNEEGEIVKNSIDAAITETLRPTLGAQFTEQEGERIKSLQYNPKLPPEENLRRAKQLQQFIDKKIQTTDAMYQYMEQNNGSIQGFPFEKFGMRAQGSTSVNQAPSDIDSKIENFMKKNNISNKEEAIKILKDNGKL